MSSEIILSIGLQVFYSKKLFSLNITNSNLLIWIKMWKMICYLYGQWFKIDMCSSTWYKKYLTYYDIL